MNRRDGMPIPLAAPFEKINVTYPFEWAQPNRLHMFDEGTGEGTVYNPEYARALATAILQALGDLPLPVDYSIFEPVPNSRTEKIRCRWCEHTGYPNVMFSDGHPNPQWWGYGHHVTLLRCPDCDKPFCSKPSLAAHRRVRHA